MGLINVRAVTPLQNVRWKPIFSQALQEVQGAFAMLVSRPLSLEFQMDAGAIQTYRHLVPTIPL